jgi:hypothetical protein
MPIKGNVTPLKRLISSRGLWTGPGATQGEKKTVYAVADLDMDGAAGLEARTAPLAAG